MSDPEELALQTDPANADSDGDGLSDGEEVYGTGTDPTLWDTDVDGASDGADADGDIERVSVDAVPPSGILTGGGGRACSSAGGTSAVPAPLAWLAMVALGWRRRV